MSRRIVLIVAEPLPDILEFTYCHWHPKLDYRYAANLSSATPLLETQSVACLILVLPSHVQHVTDDLRQLSKMNVLLPIIVIGDNDVDNAVTAMKNGAKDYLVRDGLDAQRLAMVIDSVCQQRVDETVHDNAIKQALQLAVDGIAFVNAKGFIVYVNDTYAMLFKKHKSDFVGQYWLDDYFCTENFIKKARDNDEGKVSLELIGKRHRQPFDLRMTLVRYQGKNDIGHYCFIQETTQQKKLERDLRDAKSFQELVLESHTDYIFVKDRSFRIVFANKKFLQLYPKQQQDKIIGYTTVESYTQEDREKFLEKDRKAFQCGRSQVLETIDFPDGKKRILSTTKVRFNDSSGEVFILGHARDVTEREQLIKSLRQTNDDLDKFAHIASHDLKSPLRAIEHISQWIREDAWSQLDETNRARLDRLISRVNRMEYLLDDLLSYSRAGRSRISEKCINAYELIDEMLTDLLFCPPGITIRPSQALRAIRIPIMPVKQILHNLLTNAIKHHDKAIGCINIDCRVTEKHFVFVVRDDGPGIAPQFQKKIFEMFQTLKPRDEIEGSGIGLALVKKLVKRHGGDVFVESELGAGSTFIVQWPRQQLSISEYDT